MEAPHTSPGSSGGKALPRFSGRALGAVRKNPRREAIRKKKAIQAALAAQRRELGLQAPSFRRGPAFYLGVIAIMALLGVGVISQADKADGIRQDYRVATTQKNLNAIAEALGRFRFHVGRYPAEDEGHLTDQRVADWRLWSADRARGRTVRGWMEPEDTNIVDGIEVLAEKPYVYEPPAGWNGPYLERNSHTQRVSIDPWGRRYVYECPDPAATNAVPIVISCGPDGVRGTADDLLPEAACFTRPFRDTTWTNGWVSFRLRGIIVTPREGVRP